MILQYLLSPKIGGHVDTYLGSIYSRVCSVLLLVEMKVILIKFCNAHLGQFEIIDCKVCFHDPKNSFVSVSNSKWLSNLPMKQKLRLDLGLICGKKWWLTRQSIEFFLVHFIQISSNPTFLWEYWVRHRICVQLLLLRWFFNWVSFDYRCLRSDIEYKTLIVNNTTTCRDLIVMLLSKYRMRHRDPKLFYLTMDIYIKRTGKD